MRVLPCGTLFQTLNFYRIFSFSTEANVVVLFRPSQVHHTERPPLFATYCPRRNGWDLLICTAQISCEWRWTVLFKYDRQCKWLLTHDCDRCN